LKNPNFEIVRKIRRYCIEIDNTLKNVELAHKLSDDFKKEHPGYNWNGAYKLRNIIGHDYEVVSNESLWKAGQQSRTKLLGYTTELLCPR
jgi:hypothetical protein